MYRYNNYYIYAQIYTEIHVCIYNQDLLLTLAN